jgi:hypothetical protein
MKRQEPITAAEYTYTVGFGEKVSPLRGGNGQL